MQLQTQVQCNNRSCKLRFCRTFSLLLLLLNTVHVIILSSYPASWGMAIPLPIAPHQASRTQSLINSCVYLCAWTINIQKDETKIWILYEEISRNLFGLSTLQSSMHGGSSWWYSLWLLFLSYIDNRRHKTNLFKLIWFITPFWYLQRGGKTSLSQSS